MSPKADASPIAAWGWKRRIALFVGLGAVAALGQAPTDFWWATLIALAVACGLMPVTTGARAFWQGWALGAGYFAVSLRWIISPFLVDIERDGWMAPFAILFMAGGFALFWGAAALVAHRFTRWTWLGLPLALALVEALRAFIFTGFPWALIGHSLIETPLAQLAAYGGPHLLTLLMMIAAGALATRDKRVALPIALVAGTALPILRVSPPPLVDGPMVRLVQPNAPQDQKWDPVMSQVFFNRMLGYTGEGDVPALVVWPESAIPMLLNHADEALAQISDAARGAPVVVGANREEGGLYYNSFVHLGRGGQINGLYDKQHLVPFGEYIPGGDLLHRIGIRGYSASYGGGFSQGAGTTNLMLPGIGPIRPLICYEGIFAEEIGGEAERPRAMILITNDAWFGKAAGPLQHLAQARLRAIEQGLPMIRVANTGVSAMIDAKGRITGQIALNTAGFLDVALPSADAATLYSRRGDMPVLVLLILIFIGLSIYSRYLLVDRYNTDA